MAIYTVVDSLDEVDAKYHDLYTEKNGKFELTEVVGIKTQADVERVQSALAKERNDHKALKDKYSFLKGMDAEAIQEMVDKYPELEAAAAGRMDDEAIQKLVEAKLNTSTAPLKRELDKARADLAESNAAIEAYTAKERTRAIHDSVREAVAKHKGFQQAAIEDATFLAERMLEVEEGTGRVITRDIDGVTPGVDAIVWLNDMQAKKPHWWGETAGGGAGGSGSGGGMGANPWTAENWNMTEQGKILTTNRARAEQLAKQAGTTIGGAKPAPRK